MKKNVIALIAGAAALCIMTAGCGSQTTDSTPAAASTAAAATSAATAATAAAAEEAGWQNDDSAFLSGIKAADYVELPDGYKHQTVEAAKPVDPTDEEVEQRIEAVLQSSGTLEEVDRRVEEWDTVSIDYVGKIDGKEFEGGTGSYDLVIGSGAFIEGFEEGLIGAKKGETKDLELKFPENYPAEDVAGKDVVFTVTVNKISDYKLNDDFVKSLNLTNAFGQAVTDVDTFQDYVRSNMIEENEAAYTWTVKHQIDNQLLEACTFKQDPPAKMLESYNFQYQNYLNNAASASYMDLATYMQRQYGATEDNYEDMIRDFARQGAQLGIIYQAIADALGVELKACHVATDFLVEAGKPFGFDFEGSLRGDKSVSVVFDNRKLKRAVPDMVTKVPFTRGIRITLDYVLSHPECQTEDPEFDAWCDRVIEAQEKAKQFVTETAWKR